MIEKNNKKRRLITIVACVLAAAVVAFVILMAFSGSKVSRDVSVSEAQTIVDATFKELPKPTAMAAKTILDKTSVTVNSLRYGKEKDVILSCSYTAVDVKGVVEARKQEFVDAAYEVYADAKAGGSMANATKICLAVSKDIVAALNEAPTVSGTIDLYLYEVAEGEFKLYLSDEIMDACTGGLITANNLISAMDTAYYNGEAVNIANSNTLRTGIKDCWALVNYDSQKPITGNAIQKLWQSFTKEFNRNFIEGQRWRYLLSGLGTTLAITGCAGLLGIVLGFIIAIIRCTNETTGKLVLIDRICRVYLTVIRGTPVMVQLLIIYFVLLLPIGVPKFISAVLCFGLNSGAYVAEIVRGGIMSVDKGQNEAGRSLGFNFSQTMIHFIIPQAFKAVLPSLANEFITLLKESSVAFYIGVADLTQGGLKIRSITYSNFMPLIAVALIYLVIVLILTKLVGILERRLRKSDH